MNKATYTDFAQSICPEVIAAIPVAVVHEWITQGLVTARQLDKYIKAIVYLHAGAVSNHTD